MIESLQYDRNRVMTSFMWTKYSQIEVVFMAGSRNRCQSIGVIVLFYCQYQCYQYTSLTAIVTASKGIIRQAACRPPYIIRHIVCCCLLTDKIAIVALESSAAECAEQNVNNNSKSTPAEKDNKAVSAERKIIQTSETDNKKVVKKSKICSILWCWILFISRLVLFSVSISILTSCESNLFSVEVPDFLFYLTFCFLFQRFRESETHALTLLSTKWNLLIASKYISVLDVWNKEGRWKDVFLYRKMTINSVINMYVINGNGLLHFLWHIVVLLLLRLLFDFGRCTRLASCIRC